MATLIERSKLPLNKLLVKVAILIEVFNIYLNNGTNNSKGFSKECAFLFNSISHINFRKWEIFSSISDSKKISYFTVRTT